MPHTTPTHRVAGDLTHQNPAPPISRDDLLQEAQRHPRLQRQNWTSNNYNTVQAVARVFVDWVMEDEVPAGNHPFLDYPTRRAFIEDRVQLRVQVHKVALVNPRIAIFLYDADRPPTEYALVLVSDNNDAVDLQNAHVPAQHLARKDRNFIGDLTTVRGETGIYLEVHNGKNRSFIATTITLPAPADPEVVSVRYHTRVEIIAGGQTYVGHSPIIEAVRWWAKPSQNLAVERTRATTVTPRIDGEDYFGRVAALLQAAIAGDHVYLASWSFNPFTMMTGGQNAVTNAVAVAAPPPDPANAFADTLAGHINTAVANGVIVHILLDSINAPFGAELLDHLKTGNFFHPHNNNIEVRSSGHPKHIKVGVGQLARKERVGSYHEKYVILTGSQHVALIGGIDAEADRMNPAGHAWRHREPHYNALLKKHFYTHPGDAAFVDHIYAGGKNGLWHDVGVEVDGQRAIHDLCADFIRRWNAGAGDGNNIVAPPAPVHPPGERNLQFVKTDRLKQAHGNIPAGHHLGTFDATIQAVRAARHYIYMENQYMRDQQLAAAIADAMRANTGLQVILVIPFITEEAAAAGNRHFANRTALWMLKEPGKKIQKVQERASIHGDYLQARFIAALRAVDPARVGVYALAKYVNDFVPNIPEQIYPHAKTMVVDDTWAYIGSANANGRSLKLDGESGYVVHDRAVVTAYRHALWQEHLTVAPPSTRELRAVLAHWDANAVKGHNHVMTLTKPDLQNTAAVELQNPPQGQKYNGPGSWLIDLHDFV